MSSREYPFPERRQQDQRKKRQEPPVEGVGYSNQVNIGMFIQSYYNLLADKVTVQQAFNLNNMSNERNRSLNEEAYNTLVHTPTVLVDRTGWIKMAEVSVENIRQTVDSRTKEYIIRILSFGRHHIEYMVSNLSILSDVRQIEADLFYAVSHDIAVNEYHERNDDARPSLYLIITNIINKYEVPLQWMLFYLIFFRYMYKKMFQQNDVHKIETGGITFMAAPYKCINLILMQAHKCGWKNSILIFNDSSRTDDPINRGSRARNEISSHLKHFTKGSDAFFNAFGVLDCDTYVKDVLAYRDEDITQPRHVTKYRNEDLNDMALNDFRENQLYEEYERYFTACQDKEIRALYFNRLSELVQNQNQTKID